MSKRHTYDAAKKKQKTYYVAGPMRGIPNFNFPMFDSVADALRRDFTVINPADLDRLRNPEIEKTPGFADGDFEKLLASGFDWHRVIGQDLVAIINDADGIVLLPGWENSLGANHERYVAEATGKEIWSAHPDGDDGHWYFTTPVVNATPDRADGEHRVVNEKTGGAKGSKLARFELIPAGPLQLLAEHYGRGSQKYDDRNWEKGYAWSLSFGAMMRHAWAFWGGEDLDPETGSPHVVAVAWHALSLAEFMVTHRDLDDRSVSQTG